MAVANFTHPDPEVIKAWETLTIELRFDPKTGNKKPWEVRGVFTYPHKRSVHWGSYKTLKAARKAVAKEAAKYQAESFEVNIPEGA